MTNEITPTGAAPELMDGLGVCGDCKFRDISGHCLSEKLAEDYGQGGKEKADMLIYDYSEGGGFWVGERFGCIHHTSNVEHNRTAAHKERD